MDIARLITFCVTIRVITFPSTVITVMSMDFSLQTERLWYGQLLSHSYVIRNNRRKIFLCNNRPKVCCRISAGERFDVWWCTLLYTSHLKYKLSAESKPPK